MSYADIEELHPQSPPRKKRRFFVDEDSSKEDESLNQELALPEENGTLTDSNHAVTNSTSIQDAEPQFDEDTFVSIIDEQLPDHAIRRIRDISGDDLQRGTRSF